MTVDLRTGEEYVPRREDFCTKIAAVAPANIATPLWRAFLDKITAGDSELKSYLKRMAGYCMTGDTSEHVLFFLYGTGANGKSVYVNTLRGIWGDYASAAPMTTFMTSHTDQHPTDLAMLRGVRLVVAQETEIGRQWAETKIKSITGGDPITARFMRQDFFTYTPRFKIVIAGNHKPSLGNVDEAIRRRLHLVPFTITIPPEERDKELFDKLKPEWPLPTSISRRRTPWAAGSRSAASLASTCGASGPTCGAAGKRGPRPTTNGPALGSPSHRLSRSRFCFRSQPTGPSTSRYRSEALGPWRPRRPRLRCERRARGDGCDACDRSPL